MDNAITLDYNSLYELVERSLSVIGKRSIDDKGELLFRDITLGSREKKIVFDFFATAFIDLCAELGKFITAQMETVSGITSFIYTTFWTDQAASSFVNQITATGQYLYKYDSGDLYVSSLSFPFSTIAPATNALFVYQETYYKWNSGLTQLTDEEVAELTDEQKAAATTLTYYNEDPTSVTASQADVYLYYNGSVYKSSRNASFSSASIPAGAAIVDPQGRAYVREGNQLINVPTETAESVSLTITVPDNWNTALLVSLTQSLKGYCVAYALYSWFVITAPRIADKYLEDCKRLLAASIRLVHEKKEPAAASVSPVDISVTTTTSNT